VLLPASAFCADTHRCLPVRADAVSKIQAGLQGVNFGMLWFDVGESCLSASKAASSPSWFRFPPTTEQCDGCWDSTDGANQFLIGATQQASRCVSVR
jgi:hypothetical protein